MLDDITSRAPFLALAPLGRRLCVSFQLVFTLLIIIAASCSGFFLRLTYLPLVGALGSHAMGKKKKKKLLIAAALILVLLVLVLLAAVLHLILLLRNVESVRNAFAYQYVALLVQCLI